MKAITIEQIINYSKGRGHPNRASIDQVMIDSRQIGPGCLFVPLKGEQVDGHQFIEEVLAEPTAFSLCEKTYAKEHNLEKHPRVILVDDSLQALGDLAKGYAKDLNIPIIGVTGSTGKTTTKNMIDALVSRVYKTHKTKGNYNNLIGLPLTILSCDPEAEVMILEMGMDRFGEIMTYVQIAPPSIGVITNIGTSHMEFLGSKEGIRKAKYEITSEMKKDQVLVRNGFDEFLLQGQPLQPCKICDTRPGELKDLRLDDKGHYSFTYKGVRVDLPVLGRHNVENALLALEVGKLLDISYEEGARGLKTYQGEAMRLELEDTWFGKLLNDAYNASPASMKSAIETLVQVPATRHLAILGDMLELGEQGPSLHAEIGQEEALHKVDLLITIGSLSREIGLSSGRNIGKSWLHFENSSEAAKQVPSILQRGDILLLKGSRGIKLERIKEAIKE